MESNPIKTLSIDRSVLEAAVPAAQSKNDGIYNALLPHIRNKASRLCWRLLGTTVCGQILNGEHDELRTKAAWLACMDAFVENIRSLDVVLTNTGFGVVSTQDTAPASAIRVDALLAQLETTALEVQDDLLDGVVQIDGWDGDPQDYFETVFYKFGHLKQYGSKREPTADDWWAAQPSINDADMKLRELLGEDQIGLLLTHITTNSTSKEEERVLRYMRQFTAAVILDKDERIVHQYKHKVLEEVEENLDEFPYYAESVEYQARHYEGYENTRESSMFLFGG